MNDYRHEASWAVWETDAEGNLTGNPLFPLEQAAPVVHGRAMIVSLNPASEIAGATVEEAAWANFHSPIRKHNDLFLAHAFHRTRFWGAFMTDLHPDVADPNSRTVVVSKKGAVEPAVKSLIAQAKLLGEVEDIICVGGATYGGISRHAELIKQELGVSRSRLRPITHYSGSARGKHGNKASRYGQLVRSQLGLN
jgi:hypothetical protein